MRHVWFGSTRRRALSLLLFILLTAPIPLMDIQERHDPHAAPSSGPNWVWLFIVFVVMGSALRGNRSALGLWSALSGVIGVAMVAWSFSAADGSIRLLGGLLAIAASIVFALLRDELADKHPVAPADREHASVS
jgi:hypothetical protein